MNTSTESYQQLNISSKMKSQALETLRFISKKSTTIVDAVQSTMSSSPKRKISATDAGLAILDRTLLLIMAKTWRKTSLIFKLRPLGLYRGYKRTLISWLHWWQLVKASRDLKRIMVLCNSVSLRLSFFRPRPLLLSWECRATMLLKPMDFGYFGPSLYRLQHWLWHCLSCMKVLESLCFVGYEALESVD